MPEVVVESSSPGLPRRDSVITETVIAIDQGHVYPLSQPSGVPSGCQTAVRSEPETELQPGVHGLTFQGEDTEHTFMDAPEWFLKNESFQAFDP